MPYLEISIYNTQEKELSIEELIIQIGNAYTNMYATKNCTIDKSEKRKVIVQFDSKQEFDEIYNKSYNLYVYLFDNFLTKYPEFSTLFSNIDEEVKDIRENYMTLRYTTDYLLPLRRYYGFTNRVNKIFGAKVYNEEIENGYFRFIHSKEDYLHLIQPADFKEDWKKIFKLRNVPLDHPLINAFFETFDKWNHIWESKQQE